VADFLLRALEFGSYHRLICFVDRLSRLARDSCAPDAMRLYRENLALKLQAGRSRCGGPWSPRQGGACCAPDACLAGVGLPGFRRRCSVQRRPGRRLCVDNADIRSGHEPIETRTHGSDARPCPSVYRAGRTAAPRAGSRSMSLATTSPGAERRTGTDHQVQVSLLPTFWI
jgi:hypothetical protein